MKDLTKLKIYLAGPMFECSPDDMHGWREALQDNYGHIVDFLDPTTHICTGEKDDVVAVVEKDKKAILSADVVLAHTWKASPGTSMEILFAHTNDIPVYVVADSEISGWVHYHATGVYEKFIDAMGDIFDKVPHRWDFNLYAEARRALRVGASYRSRIRDGVADPLAVETEAPDMVNHPPHYTMGGIETKDYIRAKSLSYNCGNAVKYITRAGHKVGVCPVQDLKKAVFYLNDEIDNMES